MRITHENAVIGKEYFTADGECFKLAALLPDGKFAGYRSYVTGDGESDFLETMDKVSRLFTEPPTQRYHHDIEALQARLQEYEETKARVGKEIDAMLAEHKRLSLLFSSNKAASNLALFLEKKITHVAVGDFSNGWDIVELEKLQVYDDSRFRRPEGIQLISLFGNSKGDLLWRVNEYRDGSGSWRATLPATSKENAEEQIRNHINYLLVELAKDNPSVDKGYRISSQVVQALKWQVAIPENLMAIHLEYQEKKRRTQLDDLKKQLKRTTAEITKLENQP